MTIYFISGHLDLTATQWKDHYQSEIDRILEAEPDARFVMGEARGADQMSISYLWEQFKSSPEQLSRVTIYHLFTKPRYNPGFPNTQGGFQQDEERDRAMTLASDRDLAWVRSEQESRKLYGKKYRPGRISGTQKNLNRRNENF